MKKIISTLAAVMMTATSLASTAVSAVSIPVLNEYSLSTSTVVSDIVVDDITVPAGSLAVTVNISNNTGFSSSSTKIVLGDAYAPITDENGMLAVQSGNVIGDSCICGVTNGGLVFVSTASGEDNLYNGDMFTFYVSSNTSSGDKTIEIVNTESEDIATTMRNAASTMSLASGWFCVGDVNNDGYINASDASAILGAVQINQGNKIFVDVANDNLSYYFPDEYNIVCAQAANPLCGAQDDDGSGEVEDKELMEGLVKDSINKRDADDILVYYGLAATKQLKDYPNQSDGFCGRTLYFKGKN
ncbi:MAG: hypothetical protein K2K91_08380 [Ruminococcus sp.]|nr:hypothetical protein [Ruminococcus sp.]